MSRMDFQFTCGMIGIILLIVLNILFGANNY